MNQHTVDVNDIVGKTFGLLKIIKLDKNKNKFGNSQYLCECKCGRQKIVSRSSLLTKHSPTRTCGSEECHFKYVHKSLIGMKFNRLTPVEIVSTKEGIYRCKCDCGNETFVRVAPLKNGTIKSCGCFRREMCSNFGKLARKQNKIEVLGDITRIYFEDGDYTEIDTEDYPKISQYWWVKNRTGYVITTTYTTNGGKRVFMHRIIMNNTNPNLVTHHIDHNILNNRKSNLANITTFENMADSNRKLSKSGYRNIKKTVYRGKNGNILTYYEVSMRRKRKSIYIGNFKNLDDAIIARDKYCEENNIFINRKGEKIKWKN